MTKTTMPEPVARQFQDRAGKWYGFIDQRHYENTLADGTWPIRNLITTTQAEAYADARVREALEEAYQSAREVEEKLLADHLQHVSGPAAANYVANRIRALLPSTPARPESEQ